MGPDHFDLLPPVSGPTEVAVVALLGGFVRQGQRIPLGARFDLIARDVDVETTVGCLDRLDSEGRKLNVLPGSQLCVATTR